MKVVICGSMRLSERMREIGAELITRNYDISLPKFIEDYCGLGNPEQMHSESAQNKVNYDLIRGYHDVISQGDGILVVNEKLKGIEGYVGGNSFLEMGFAHILDKPIYLLRGIPYMDYTDEIIAMKPIVINGDLERIKNAVE